MFNLISKSILLICFIISSHANSAMISEATKREIKIKLLDGIINGLKVAATPAYILGGLTGCVEAKQADSCPVFNHDAIDPDRYLNGAEITNLKELCSPQAIGYPDNFFNSSDFSLPSPCRQQLIKVIPWYTTIRGGVSSYERTLKNQFVKTIWLTMFVPRLTPSLTSESGLYCPSIENSLLGADEITSSFDYTKWLEGDYMDKRILNVIKGANIKVGFKSSELCNYSIAYFSQEDNNYYICRNDGDDITDYGIIGSAMTLAHELRHSVEIFDSGTLHVECSGGATNCDDGELGSYGTGTIFLDQLITGMRLLHSIATLDETKTDIIKSVKDSIFYICIYRSNILNKESNYFDTLSSYDVCDDPSDNDIQYFLEDNYYYSFD